MGNEKNLKETKNLAKGSVSNNKTYTLTKVSLIVIAVILVATLSLVFIQSSGIILRSNTVYETENYKVSASMMQYVVNGQYQKFYSDYGMYASSFGLDTTKSLKLQKFDKTNYFVSMFLGLGEEFDNFEGTWYDYFWKISEDQMMNILVLCEAAKAANITLDQAEKDKIDEEIDNLYKDMDSINEENRKYYEENYGQKNYVTFDGIKAYLTACYGQGVKISDIRKVLELAHLSQKFDTQASADILEALKNDEAAIKSYYEGKKSNYQKADYLSFTFSASYTKPSDSTKVDSTWATYLTKVNEAMDNAKALSECKTEEEFKTFMIKYWFENQWQTQYDKTITELKKKPLKDGGITDADIPAEEVRNQKKAAALDQITYALLNDKTKDDLKPLGTTAFDGAIDAIKENLFDTLSSSSYYGSLEKLKMAYDESTDAGKWLFDANRQAGDIKYFANHDVEFIGTETVAPETTAPETTNTPSATESAPAATEASPEATDVAPTAETAPESTSAETPAETPKAEPNWKTELDKEKADDAKFTVEVRFVIKPSYRIDDFVREFGHILVTGDSFTAEDKTLSEEDADKKAKEKADKLLADLKAGTVTKESFETLAKENTEDSGVYYSDVAPMDMVEEVNDWIFAEGRKVGDLEVVKSEFGYHVMYLTEITDDPAYLVEARTDLYAERLEAQSKEWKDTYTIKSKTDYAKNNIKLINE